MTRTDLPPLLRSPRRAYLVLTDGTVFSGFGAGAPRIAVGEVVFNTAMTGYQEMLTDPSYRGQILTLTTSHVGQVGTNAADAESARAWVEALVVQELDELPSSWRAESSLPSWLEAQGVAVGWGFDTRTVVRHVRAHGAVPGVLATDGTPLETLRELAGRAAGTDGRDLTVEVASREPYSWEEPPWQAPDSPPPEPTRGPRVVVVDYGVKYSTLRRLVGEGLQVDVVPPSLSVDAILQRGVAGVVLSNGPGDPAAVTSARELVHGLVGQVPVLGICLGHQLLGLALGGRTVKLPFGHHGGNHPVREIATGRVLITSQNHNYAVEEASLPREVEVTHLNLTDGTVEGLALPRQGVEAVQFHPEAGPGPSDAVELFARFAARCREAGS